MNKFIKAYEEAIINTIEGLSLVIPSINLREIEDISLTSLIISPVFKIDLINKNTNDKISFIYGGLLISYLSKFILGELSSSDYEEGLSPPELNVIEKIQFNVLDQLKQEGFLNHYEIENCEYISLNEDINLDDFSKSISFTFSFNEVSGLIYILSQNLFNDKDPEINKTKTEDIKSMKFNLLDDVQIKVSVLLGSKLLSLEEISSLKDNSTIELNQLANDPLTIFVNNVPYAEGEVVIVDGMYGVQITRMFSKEDVYHV